MRHPRGLTLIEIMVAIAIAAVLFGAVVVGLGALTGQKARQSAGELAGVIRGLYDTAALSGRTCRLAFIIPGERSEEPVTYRAECAEGAVTTARDRDKALQEDTRSAEQAAREAASGRAPRDARRSFASAGDEPTLDELMAQEKQRVEKASQFSEYTSEAMKPRELPSGVALSVWTRHQREAVSQGVAYLYFFPQGFTEKAHVAVRQGDNVWTLVVSPLTGKVQVVAEELEVPRS